MMTRSCDCSLSGVWLHSSFSEPGFSEATGVRVPPLASQQWSTSTHRPKSRQWRRTGVSYCLEPTETRQAVTRRLS